MWYLGVGLVVEVAGSIRDGQIGSGIVFLCLYSGTQLIRPPCVSAFSYCSAFKRPYK